MNSILDRYAAIITRYTIAQWEVEPTSSRFKAEVEFTDNSILAVKDYNFPSGRKYAFHWRDSDENLIVRWDNAPHWREIKTFPYHAHEGEFLTHSEEMTLGEVLRYISKYLKKKEPQGH